MTQCEIMSSCSTNFPFSLACNGHGLCQPFPSNNITQISNPQAVCQCMGGYSASGSGLDLFVDPGTVPCFIPRSYLTTANVCLFVTTALAFLRVLQIVFFWIVSCFEKRYFMLLVVCVNILEINRIFSPLQLTIAKSPIF